MVIFSCKSIAYRSDADSRADADAIFGRRKSINTRRSTSPKTHNPNFDGEFIHRVVRSTKKKIWIESRFCTITENDANFVNVCALEKLLPLCAFNFSIAGRVLRGFRRIYLRFSIFDFKATP